MAGRGTDIVLGGNAEQHARRELAKLGPDATDEEREAVVRDALARLEPEFAAEGERVKELGGLLVIGTERHESRRIDNQLRGRSGRQGDPGASRFYLSLEDDLMRLFNASAVDRIMTRLKIPDDVPIEHQLVSRAVANAQRQVESVNFDRRKNVLKYDDVMNEQRKVVYGQRQRLLEADGPFIEELAQKYFDDAIDQIVDEHCPPESFADDWDLEGLRLRLDTMYDASLDIGSFDRATVDRDELVQAIVADAEAARERRVAEVGGEAIMREVERRVVLTVIDRHWREHLYEMDALRDGIGLRAVGQRDPLTEYQREAYDSFAEMMSGVKEEAVTYFFRIPIERVDAAPTGAADPIDVARSIPLGTQPMAGRLAYTAAGAGGVASAASASGSTVTVDDQGRDLLRREDGSTVRQVAAGGTYTTDERVGRNDPCPCGSGAKFKRCHGA
jgi:preprotein translocase subunit SecA